MKVFLKDSSIKIKSFTLDNDEGGNSYLLIFDNYDQIKMEEVINIMKEIPSVKEIYWTR